MLGQLNLSSPEGGEVDISNLEGLGGLRHGSKYSMCLCGWKREWMRDGGTRVGGNGLENNSSYKFPSILAPRPTKSQREPFKCQMPNFLRESDAVMYTWCLRLKPCQLVAVQTCTSAEEVKTTVVTEGVHCICWIPHAQRYSGCLPLCFCLARPGAVQCNHESRFHA